MNEEENVTSEGSTSVIDVTPEQSSDTESKTIHLTEAALKKVRLLLAVEKNPDLKLRIAVQPGGCSGLIYQLFFDNRVIDGDIIENHTDEVAVVVDRMSAPYLQGAMIDYTDTIYKQGFTLDNPNAAGSCACGDSFH